jgi:N-acetylglucosaminyldiphosphoundecaprenol N-acetyl-beta-D-mannosaminyltransferase
MTLALSTITLRGVSLHAITPTQCIDHILGSIDRGKGGWVVTPNLDHLRRSVRDQSFADLCAQADLRVADGMPLIWASRLQGTPLPARVAGSDLISTLSSAAAKQGRSIFLLGGEPGTAEQAANVLRQRDPSLRIAGCHCPPPGFEKNPAQRRAMETALRDAQPDIVFVALGSPKQERLIASLRAALPSTWWLGVGISFSFLSGHVKRAPRWAQVLGLEWAHRLAQEPKRLARRYLVEGVPFALSLLTRCALARPGRAIWRTQV